ncbi:formate dehydrogenase accessory sulfurtransferase FdhD [Bacillaceae bacterium S4-13-58]
MIIKASPEEYPITLYLNNQEIGTFQMTREDLEDWAIGYLFSEGMIDGIEDVVELKVHKEEGRVLVERQQSFSSEDFQEKKKIFTAGCGRGTTFFSLTDVKQFPRIVSDMKVSLTFLLKKRHEFSINSPMYLETGGMHGACIVLESGEIVVREDIGRHNAVDKVIGFAIRNKIKPEGTILITTGRISYEMLAKAARFGFAVVGSRTAATKQAVQLAKYLNLSVVGYIRGKMVTVYHSNGRIIDDLAKKAVGNIT